MDGIVRATKVSEGEVSPGAPPPSLKVDLEHIVIEGIFSHHSPLHSLGCLNLLSRSGIEHLRKASMDFVVDAADHCSKEDYF